MTRQRRRQTRQVIKISVLAPATACIENSCIQFEQLFAVSCLYSALPFKEWIIFAIDLFFLTISFASCSGIDSSDLKSSNSFLV